MRALCSHSQRTNSRHFLQYTSLKKAAKREQKENEGREREDLINFNAAFKAIKIFEDHDSNHSGQLRIIKAQINEQAASEILEGDSCSERDFLEP